MLKISLLQNGVRKDDYVRASVNWLLKVKDSVGGGWGMYELHPTRIVTTAEALTGLAIAGITDDQRLGDALRFLELSPNDPDWCKYTRHHSWIVYALVRAGREVPEVCLQYLRENVRDGAWADDKRGDCTLFSTFLAWRALNAYDPHNAFSIEVCDWLLDRATNSIWSLSGGQPSYVATSYAILILTAQQNWQNTYGGDVDAAVTFLKSGAQGYWPNEHEQLVSGDHQYNFHHFTLPWVIMALLRSGVSVFEPIVVRAVDHLYLGHYSKKTGGWSEEINHRPSTFATSHVLSALEVLLESITVQNYLQKQKEVLKVNENQVFIVHGHHSIRHEVARFVSGIGCEVIILEEQTDSGVTTIFEKFTRYAASAAYAIVLMTPEDLAKDVDSGKESARARQNVILELGFFIGKLGNENVCLAQKGEVNIPSDIQGILYLDLDDAGGWKLKLAKKMKAAGLNVDLNKV